MDYCNMDQCGDTSHRMLPYSKCVTPDNGLLQYGPVWGYLTGITAMLTNVSHLTWITAIFIWNVDILT